MAVEIPYDLDRLRFMPVGKSRAFVRRFGTVLLERLTGGFYLTTNGEYTEGWLLTKTHHDVRSVRTTLSGKTIVIDRDGVEHTYPILQPRTVTERQS